MRRHRVLRDIEEAGELASRNSIRFMSHEQTERLKAGVLGQGRKGGYCVVAFHISRIMDTSEKSTASKLRRIMCN